MADKIPIVDFLKIVEIGDNIGSDANWNSAADKIREGFVYLKNHGIDKSLV